MPHNAANSMRRVDLDQFSRSTEGLRLRRPSPPENDELYQQPLRAARGLKTVFILGLIAWIAIGCAVAAAVRHHATATHHQVQAK
jgi:hypothetical protein